MERLIELLEQLIPGSYLLITVASALPLIELKGGILLGFAKGLNPIYVLLLCYLGSSVTVPIILLCLRPILSFVKKVPFFGRLALSTERRLSSKAARFEQKNRVPNTKNGLRTGILAALFVFVALPLPLTGVWTGAALACFLSVDYGKALFTIMSGNLVAGLLVFGVAMLFAPYADIIFLMFLLIVVIALVSTALYSRIKSFGKKTAKFQKNNLK